jgi:hypothetical protein
VKFYPSEVILFTKRVHFSIKEKASMVKEGVEVRLGESSVSLPEAVEEAVIQNHCFLIMD